MGGSFRTLFDMQDSWPITRFPGSGRRNGLSTVAKKLRARLSLETRGRGASAAAPPGAAEALPAAVVGPAARSQKRTLRPAVSSALEYQFVAKSRHSSASQMTVPTLSRPSRQR